MIPKKIHYCWFGGKPLPKKTIEYIKSWKKYCPDYEIIEWNESNYDVTKIPFIRQAYEQKKFAFVSDYARLDIIYSEGGIYLDTDVELLKSLDSFLKYNCFMGLEAGGDVNTGLGYGAVAGHSFLKKNMEAYEVMNFNPDNLITCVKITSDLLFEQGLTTQNEKQCIGDIMIFPTEYFCPMIYSTRKLVVTPETVSIHHFEASWHSGFRKFTSLIKRRIKKVLRIPGY